MTVSGKSTTIAPQKAGWYGTALHPVAAMAKVTAQMPSMIGNSAHAIALILPLAHNRKLSAGTAAAVVARPVLESRPAMKSMDARRASVSTELSKSSASSPAGSHPCGV